MPRVSAKTKAVTLTHMEALALRSLLIMTFNSMSEKEMREWWQPVEIAAMQRVLRKVSRLEDSKTTNKER